MRADDTPDTFVDEIFFDFEDGTVESVIYAWGDVTPGEGDMLNFGMHTYRVTDFNLIYNRINGQLRLVQARASVEEVK